jgi:hypothetical protein
MSGHVVHISLLRKRLGFYRSFREDGWGFIDHFVKILFSGSSRVEKDCSLKAPCYGIGANFISDERGD